MIHIISSKTAFLSCFSYNPRSHLTPFPTDAHLKPVSSDLIVKNIHEKKAFNNEQSIYVIKPTMQCDLMMMTTKILLPSSQALGIHHTSLQAQCK